MHVQRFLAVVCIAIPAAALLSMGCGILVSPVEVPKVVATNSQLLKFSVDIVDEAGNPVDGVTVKSMRYALRLDPVFVEFTDHKPDAPQTVDKSASYSCFGNFAVGMEFSKPGYDTVLVLYSTEDGPLSIGPEFFLDMRGGSMFNEYVNIRQHPQTKLVLRKGEAETQPDGFRERLHHLR